METYNSIVARLNVLEMIDDFQSYFIGPTAEKLFAAQGVRFKVTDDGTCAVGVIQTSAGIQSIDISAGQEQDIFQVGPIGTSYFALALYPGESMYEPAHYIGRQRGIAVTVSNESGDLVYWDDDGTILFYIPQHLADVLREDWHAEEDRDNSDFGESHSHKKRDVIRDAETRSRMDAIKTTIDGEIQLWSNYVQSIECLEEVLAQYWEYDVFRYCICWSELKNLLKVF